MERVSLPGVLILLQEAWLLYKSRWVTLTIIFLPAVLIPLLITLGLFIPLKSLATAGFEGLGLVFIYFPLVFLVSSLVSWGLNALAHISLLFALKERENGVLESYKKGLTKTIPYVWIMLLWGLITLGGLVLFVIPGLIFLVWFSLSAVVLVNEDVKGMNALLKSREYIRGRWLPVAWRLFFISAALGVLGWIPTHFLPEDSISNFIRTPILLIIALFITPFAITYSFVLYRRLKEVRGEFEFRPKFKTKAWMIAMGMLSITIPLLIWGYYQGIHRAQYTQEERVDQVKLRDAQRRAHQALIQNSLQIYFNEKKSYPPSLEEVSFNNTAAHVVDPLTGEQYKYELLNAGQSYRLCIKLEEQGEKCVMPP